MNKAKLKSYAPQARKDFIAAVTARANLLGLSSKGGALEVATSQPQGDVTVIAGVAWPVKVHSQREQLVTRIQRDGFDHTMEAVAYTWFNRFAALRYMELHDYLGHGHRALSSTQGALPDILTHAADLAQSGELPGLKSGQVTEMKLAGNRDGELYRLLLVAQCNALSNAMPFLFERIDDDSELLLPDNLLRSDSVIVKLVEGIPEEDWAEVEIIGWLYQFYISEKKDQVIGKVVTAVGDDAQSIYSFRGATVRNILDFPHQFSQPARLVTLERNYRSTQPILDVSNAVIAQATDRHAKNLWTDMPGSTQPQLIMVPDEAEQARLGGQSHPGAP